MGLQTRAARLRSVTILAGIVAALGVAACGDDGDDTSSAGAGATTTQAASTEPIVIGAAVAESGFVAAFDGPPMGAAKMAIEEVNADGGVLGRQLKLVTADTASNQAQGASAAQKVLADDPSLVLVTCDYNYGSAAAITATQKGKIAFSLCAGSPKFGVQGIGPLAYTMGDSTSNEAAVMAQFAYKDKGWKTAYVLEGSDDYDKTLAQGFVEVWGQWGGEVTGKESFKSGDTSYTSVVNRIKQLPAQPDAIFLGSHQPDAGTILRQLRSAGIKTPVLSGVATDGNYWQKAVPNLSEFYYATFGSIFGDDPRPEVNAFFKNLATAGVQAPTAHAMGGYSTIQAFKIAAEKANSLDTEKLAAAYDGFKDVELLIGSTTFTPQLHVNVDRPMVVVGVQDGKWKREAFITPEKVAEAK